MAKLQVSKVTIRNILGVEEVEFEPGRLTVVSGPNGSGKTSILEAIRAALGGGNDATLVKQGAVEGEVVLLLDDGTELNKRINDKGSSLTVRHPSYGKVSKPQTVIDSLVNRLGINPIELLTAPAAKQKELFLKAMPLTVTRDQLLDATGLVYNKGNFNQHALEVMAEFHKDLYEERTGVNRAKIEKQATGRQLRESLPEEPPEGDWLTVHNRLAAELAAYELDTTSQVRDMEETRRQQISGLNEYLLVSTNQLEQEAMRRIEQIRQTLKLDTDVLKEEYEHRRQEVIDDFDLSINAAEGDRRPERDHLLTEKQHARTMADMSIKALSAKELLGKMLADVSVLNAESTAMTQALDGLDKLKEHLMKDLPISGLEVQDGQLYFHSIPLSRWNEATRVKLAIDIAKLSAGNLGLIIVDGLEKLDSESFAAFTEYVQSDDSCQYVVSRVTDSAKLSIETH